MLSEQPEKALEVSIQTLESSSHSRAAGTVPNRLLQSLKSSITDIIRLENPQLGIKAEMLQFKLRQPEKHFFSELLDSTAAVGKIRSVFISALQP